MLRAMKIKGTASRNWSRLSQVKQNFPNGLQINSRQEQKEQKEYKSWKLKNPCRNIGSLRRCAPLDPPSVQLTKSFLFLHQLNVCKRKYFFNSIMKYLWRPCKRTTNNIYYFVCWIPCMCRNNSSHMRCISIWNPFIMLSKCLLLCFHRCNMCFLLLDISNKIHKLQR